MAKNDKSIFVFSDTPGLVPTGFFTLVDLGIYRLCSFNKLRFSLATDRLILLNFSILFNGRCVRINPIVVTVFTPVFYDTHP